MERKKKETDGVDELLNELLADCQSPEEILGKSSLLKQLSKRLMKRALSRELNYHPSLHKHLNTSTILQSLLSI